MDFDLKSRYLEIFAKAFNCLAAFIQHMLMCSSKFKRSSMTTTKILTLGSEVILTPPCNSIFCCSIGFEDITMNWNLVGFAFVPLSVNHWIAFWQSCFRFSITVSMSGDEFIMEVSSAWLYKLHPSMKRNISFIKTLNRRGPRILPYGTPLFSIFHELWQFDIFTRCILWWSNYT